jgi:hypothetical protein
MFDDFFDFIRLCYRKTELPKWWGKIVNWLTLIVGWVLAWIILQNPNWTSTTQARIAFWLMVITPVSIATMVVVGRLLMSPFLVYRDLQKAHVELQGGTEAAKQRAQQIEAMSNWWSEGKKVLTRIERINDYPIEVAKNEASKWFAGVVAFLKDEWGKPDDVNYFRDCDDGADAIHNIFTADLQERNELYRGIRQRIRNLRVILDREIPKLP